MAQPANVKSPMASVFLLHAAIDGPFAAFATLYSDALPFLDMTNTTIVLTKLYSCLILGTCVASLLCYTLPDFLPGKRAFALGLLFYHVTAASALWTAPRFIPYSLGDFFETTKISPERVWAVGHGFLAFSIMLWWQSTVKITQAFSKSQKAQ